MTRALVIAAAAGLAGAAQAQTFWADYGWEDGVGTTMFTYGNVLEVRNDPAPDVGHGDRSLFFSSLAGTGYDGYVHLGWVENLNHGDTVTASVWVYDVTPDVSPSGRIWGHYGLSGDISSYAGSASGSTDYSAGTGWSQLSWTWVFDSDMDTRDALFVEGRNYVNNDGEYTYWDDVHIEVTTTSTTASIMLPDGSMVYVPSPASLALLGLGGVLAARRRR